MWHALFNSFWLRGVVTKKTSEKKSSSFRRLKNRKKIDKLHFWGTKHFQLIEKLIFEKIEIEKNIEKLIFEKIEIEKNID